MLKQLLVPAVIGYLAGFILQHLMIILQFNLFLEKVKPQQFDAANPVHSLLTQSTGMSWVLQVCWLFGIPLLMICLAIAFMYRKPQTTIVNFLFGVISGTLLGTLLSVILWATIPQVTPLHYLGYAIAAMVVILVVMVKGSKPS